MLYFYNKGERVLCTGFVPKIINCSSYIVVPSTVNLALLEIIFEKDCVIYAKNKPDGTVFTNIDFIRPVRNLTDDYLKRTRDVSKSTVHRDIALYFSAPLYSMTEDFSPWVYPDEIAVSLEDGVPNEIAKRKGFIFRRETLKRLKGDMPQCAPHKKEEIISLYGVNEDFEEYVHKIVYNFTLKKPDHSFFTLQVGKDSGYIHEIYNNKGRKLNSLRKGFTRVYKHKLLPLKHQLWKVKTI